MLHNIDIVNYFDIQFYFRKKQREFVRKFGERPIFYMKNALVFQWVIIIGLGVSSCSQKTETSEQVNINPNHSQIDLRPYSDLGTEINLIDQDGNTFAPNTTINRISLLFFGYTFCPDFCPTTLSKLISVKDLLDTENERLDILFVSVDPQRDTPTILKEYLKYFPMKVYGLTGTLDAIDKVASAFDISFTQGNPDKYGNYSVDHSTSIYLLDTDHRVRYVFEHNVTPTMIVSTLRELWNHQALSVPRLVLDDPLLAAKDLGSRGCSILSEEEHEGYRLWSKRYQTLSRSKNNMILQPSYNFQLTQ